MAIGDYDDPLEAAKRRMLPQRGNQSFFPAANLNRFSNQSDLNDLLNQSPETQFLGTPKPTPTPTPTQRSYFSVVNPQNTGFITPPNLNQFGMNTRFRPQQYDQFNQLYGWT